MLTVFVSLLKFVICCDSLLPLYKHFRTSVCTSLHKVTPNTVQTSGPTKLLRPCLQTVPKGSKSYLEPVPEPHDLGLGVTDDLAMDNDGISLYSFSRSRLGHEQRHFRVPETGMETVALQCDVTEQCAKATGSCRWDLPVQGSFRVLPCDNSCWSGQCVSVAVTVGVVSVCL
jgi:hypothetical protein